MAHEQNDTVLSEDVDETMDSANKSLKEGKEPVKETKEELTEEEMKLKKMLQGFVEILLENDKDNCEPCLKQLKQLIRSATTSMTSVPLPLKFLRPYYDQIKNVYCVMEESESKKQCADIISILSVTYADTMDGLEYRLLGSQENVASWGHEYVRHLTTQIIEDYYNVGARKEDDPTFEQRKVLMSDIITYLLCHNAETEACDLVLEMESVHLLEGFITDSNYRKVCDYMLSLVDYSIFPENYQILKQVLKIELKHKAYVNALLISVRLDDFDTINDIIKSTKNEQLLQYQLAYILGEIVRDPSLIEMSNFFNEGKATEIINNSDLSERFHSFGNELDIMTPKDPKDIFKSHFDSQIYPVTMDKKRQHLVSSFVNAFINAGFSCDNKITKIASVDKWLNSHSDNGKISATASLGLVYLWDINTALTSEVINSHLYSTNDSVQAGAFLALGIMSSGISDTSDPAYALLSDNIKSPEKKLKIPAVVGLGVAYAGTNRKDVVKDLLGIIELEKAKNKVNFDLIGFVCVSIGLICTGSGDADVLGNILSLFYEHGAELGLQHMYTKQIIFGVALICLNLQNNPTRTMQIDNIRELVGSSLPDDIKEVLSILIESFIHAGSGNVVNIQSLLQTCSKHHVPLSNEEIEEKKKVDADYDAELEKQNFKFKQSVATMCLGLVCMGEDIGCSMSFRIFGQLLRYGEKGTKKAVPLAMALTALSNPKLSVLDSLNKFSHDQDSEIAHNSIMAMGFLGAGTNNARLAAMLRSLALYYHKDHNNLYCVRLAQGLTHLGKGTLSLSPFYYDQRILHTPSLAAILIVLYSCLDIKTTILDKYEYMLYYIAPAIHSKMLITVDKELKNLPVTVRVGQAVDVVGQAGKPKTITGFQTHTTPVLLSHGERGELATKDYTSLTPIIEGVVILESVSQDVEMKNN